MTEAQQIFGDISIVITPDSRDLGAAVEAPEYVKKYVEKKVETWCSELQVLSRIAHASPHAARSRLTPSLDLPTAQNARHCRSLPLAGNDHSAGIHPGTSRGTNGQ